MNNEHPITPPPELVREWLGNHFGTTVTGEVSGVELALATQSARWGADQELEACAEWVGSMFHGHKTWADELRNDRRPKPPSLKEQALAKLAELESDEPGYKNDLEVLRRALEALPE